MRHINAWRQWIIRNKSTVKEPYKKGGGGPAFFYSRFTHVDVQNYRCAAMYVFSMFFAASDTSVKRNV